MLYAVGEKQQKCLAHCYPYLFTATVTPRLEGFLQIKATAQSTILRYPLKITLNSREAEVLRYICLGCSNKTIADFSYVSVSLVKKIKTTIFRKLGVANRAEAIIFVKKMNPGQYWDITPDTDE